MENFITLGGKKLDGTSIALSGTMERILGLYMTILSDVIRLLAKKAFDL
ncbi:hypothetical protein ACIQ57_08265 [Lysinibacillus xylanilyticus]